MKNIETGVSTFPLLNIGNKLTTIITIISGEMMVADSFTLFAKADSTDIRATIRIVVDMIITNKSPKSLPL